MRTGRWLLAALLLGVLTGCGGEKPAKPDVPIFMMSQEGTPDGVDEKMQTSLRRQVGDQPTLDVRVSPVFMLQKLYVEIAAGGNGILIIPEEQFKGMSQQGGFVPLDEVASAADYPEGVLELPWNGQTEKHLYGIPLDKSKWFSALNINAAKLYAFVPANAPNVDKAKLVIKQIAAK